MLLVRRDAAPILWTISTSCSTSMLTLGWYVFPIHAFTIKD